MPSDCDISNFPLFALLRRTQDLAQDLTIGYFSASSDAEVCELFLLCYYYCDVMSCDVVSLFILPLIIYLYCQFILPLFTLPIIVFLIQIIAQSSLCGSRPMFLLLFLEHKNVFVQNRMDSVDEVDLNKTIR
jgi:hypothetical protein